jgi:hypothetical protein
MSNRIHAALVLAVLAASLFTSRQGAAFSGSAWAACPNHGQHGPVMFDGTTRAAWSRTWHAPNAFLTPLCQYNIPRYCNSYEPSGGVGCRMGNGEASVNGAGCAVEPAGFERLGQIPNDLDLGPLPVASGPR